MITDSFLPNASPKRNTPRSARDVIVAEQRRLLLTSSLWEIEALPRAAIPDALVSSLLSHTALARSIMGIWGGLASCLPEAEQVSLSQLVKLVFKLCDELTEQRLLPYRQQAVWGRSAAAGRRKGAREKGRLARQNAAKTRTEYQRLRSLHPEYSEEDIVAEVASNLKITPRTVYRHREMES